MKSYRRAAACLLLCLPLAGCGLLEREYRSVEPHSYSYREEAGGDALRVSSYQDLVNAVLLLAEERRETGRIHIQAEDASSGYFASARLNRQQARDSALTILREAAADETADEAVKAETAMAIHRMHNNHFNKDIVDHEPQDYPDALNR